MKVELYGLCYGCPKDKNRDDDCPLLEIKDFSFPEKVEWINQLESRRMEDILKHHLKCTKSYKIKNHSQDQNLSVSQINETES